MTSVAADVIVVGAGLAGLNAARMLTSSSRGLRVIVLEARERVGGRTLTVEDEATGVWADLGGAYITPSVDLRLMKLVDELGLQTYPASMKGDPALRPIYHGCGTSRNQLYTNIFQYLDLKLLHRRLEGMMDQVPPEAPWQAPQAQPWDQITLKEFVDRTAWTCVGRERGYRLAETVFACGPHEVSLLGMLWILRARGGMRALVGAYGPGERRIEGGSQRVSKKLAETLDVRCSDPVALIDQTDPTHVTIVTTSGTTYHSTYVILAIPPPVVSRISFRPRLPPGKTQLYQRLPMGSAIKTVTFYRKPFWREELKLSGILSTDGYPVTGTLDDSRSADSHGCITGFISGENAQSVATLTKEERRDLVLRQYAEQFNSQKFLDPILYQENNWMADEFSGGCYVSRLMPGVITTFRNELRTPYDRIHFAGSESARHCMGYMEGAVESGERAAEEILELFRSEKGAEIPTGKL